MTNHEPLISQTYTVMITTKHMECLTCDKGRKKISLLKDRRHIVSKTRKYFILSFFGEYL
jgi:hypothetical protein